MADKGKRALGSDNSNARPRKKPLTIVYRFCDLINVDDPRVNTIEQRCCIRSASLESDATSNYRQSRQNLGRKVHSWDLNELPPQEEISDSIQPVREENSSNQMANGRRNFQILNNPVNQNTMTNTARGYPHSVAALSGSISASVADIQEGSAVPQRYQRGMFLEPINLDGGASRRRTG